MPKAKNEEAGSLSKSERAKLQRLYREGKAANCSVKNIQKASGLPNLKVYVFSCRKNSYTKFRQAIRHFKRLPAFLKSISEIWCLDLAFMDKLSEFYKGVKYLLICVVVFSRLVRVQPMKSKKCLGRTLKLIECGLIQILSSGENSKNLAGVKTSKSTLQEVKQELL